MVNLKQVNTGSPHRQPLPHWVNRSIPIIIFLQEVWWLWHRKIVWIKLTLSTKHVPFNSHFVPQISIPAPIYSDLSFTDSPAYLFKFLNTQFASKVCRKTQILGSLYQLTLAHEVKRQKVSTCLCSESLFIKKSKNCFLYLKRANSRWIDFYISSLSSWLWFNFL